MYKGLIKSFLSYFMLLLVVTACSTASLQTVRMDKAEEQIILAEQALSQASSNRAIIAKENAGTANAYLATVRDYIKFLTPNEKARLQTLQQRVNSIVQRANQYL